MLSFRLAVVSHSPTLDFFSHPCLRLSSHEPQGMYLEGKTIDKKLYPEILQPCKLAYAEASTMLYERKLFRYEYRHTCVESDEISLFTG